MFKNRLQLILRRTLKSFLVSSVFSSMTLYPAGELSAQQIKSVTVQAAERAFIRDQVAIVGTLIAKEEVRVNALVEGMAVQEILIDVGMMVTKGQPLAVIDSAQANLLLEKNSVQLVRATAAVAQERSRVDVAAVTESETRKVVERSRSLVGKGAVSQQLLDEHENAFSRAKSELELARQSLLLAEADRRLIERERAEISLTIERSIVRASEGGLVLSRNARVGAMTSSSGDPLFIIAKGGEVEMEASVSEMSFVRLREGMRAEVSVPGIGSSVPGHVRLSAAQIDPSTRMGTVRLKLDQGHSLVPGSFVHGRIAIAQRFGVTVPETAIRSQNGEMSVFVVQEGRAVLRPVTLGSPTGDTIEVLTGVNEGEVVVVKSGSFLKTGEQIQAVSTPDLAVNEMTALDVEGGTMR